MSFHAYFALVKKEVRSHFVSSGTYVFLAIGWFFMAVATFYLSGFVSSNEASLTAFFNLHPWIFSFLMPALAMSVWSQEWQRQTAERLLTLPLSPCSVLLAKFTGVLSVLLVLLLGTFPIILTVFYLGEPDIGPIITGYLGSFMLGGAMLAVAMMCSMVTRSQAAAYSLGVILLFSIMFVGWGVLDRLLHGVSPQFTGLFVEYGLLDRYRYFADGLLHVRDITFFLSFALLFLGFALSGLYLKLSRNKEALVSVVVSLLIFVAANASVRPFQWHADFTANKLYTLDPSSKKLLKSLDIPLEITFYFSSNNRDVPVGLRQYVRRVDAMLALLQASNPKIKVSHVNPMNNKEALYTAQKIGITQVPLPTGEVIYFGLGFNYGGRNIVIPVLDPARADFLEFDMMSSIASARRTKRPKVAILTDLDLGDDQTRPRFMSEIFATYQIEQIRSGTPYFPKDADMVLVFLTPNMPIESVYALDQYMVNGGKVALFMDPLLRTAPTPEFLIPDRNADDLKIDHPADLLRKWGVYYDYRQIVGDRSHAMPVRHAEGSGLSTYPMFIYLGAENMNKKVGLMAGVDDMSVMEAGHFTKQNLEEGLVYTPLIQTSENSEIISREFFNMYNTQVLPKYLMPPKKKRDISMEIKGNFTSAFNEMPIEAQQFYEDQIVLNPSQVSGAKHLTQTANKGTLIAMADMDFLTDQYAIEFTQMGDRNIPKPANDNLVFVFNVVQSLLGETDVLPVRGKAIEKRTLTKIEEKIVEISAGNQDIEEKIAGQLFKIGLRLAELERRVKLENKMNIKVEEEIKSLRKQDLQLQNQLRTVRRIFKDQIEKLGRTIEGYNLFVMPLVAGVFAGLLWWRRRRQG